MQRPQRLQPKWEFLASKRNTGGCIIKNNHIGYRKVCGGSSDVNEENIEHWIKVNLPNSDIRA